MSFKDQIKAQVAAFDARVRPWASVSPWRAGAYEFLLFGLKQAWACLFGGTMVALLILTLDWARPRGRAVHALVFDHALHPDSAAWTSFALDAAQQARLSAALAKRFGREVRLHEKNMVIDYEDGVAVLKHRERWAEQLRTLAARVEVSGETVFFYTADAKQLLNALNEHPGLRTLHRPANLEDLFLKLTGRQIRENA